MSAQSLPVIDYHQVSAANSLLPQPSLYSSSGWEDLHLEVFQQPEFEIAEHQHTMHVLACGLLDSQTEQIASGERWLDGKRSYERRNVGDIAIIPAGVAHRCNWNATTQFMVLAIEPDLLHQIGQEFVSRIELLPQFMNETDLFIQSIVSTLKAELEFRQLGSHLLIDSLKTTLAIHLLRNYCTTKPKLVNNSDGLSHSTIKQVRDYIHAHLQQNLKLVELSQLAQLSPYHFLRQFKRHIGITPHQYILQCRIEAAKQLLERNELSISEIAVRTGFSDQSHLTRYFKQKFGITPRQARSQNESQ